MSAILPLRRPLPRIRISLSPSASARGRDVTVKAGAGGRGNHAGCCSCASAGAVGSIAIPTSSNPAIRSCRPFACARLNARKRTRRRHAAHRGQLDQDRCAEFLVDAFQPGGHVHGVVHCRRSAVGLVQARLRLLLGHHARPKSLRGSQPGLGEAGFQHRHQARRELPPRQAACSETSNCGRDLRSSAILAAASSRRPSSPSVAVLQHLHAEAVALVHLPDEQQGLFVSVASICIERQRYVGVAPDEGPRASTSGKLRTLVPAACDEQYLCEP